MKEITAFRNYLNEGLDKKDDKVEENIEEVDTHSEDEDVASNFKEGKMTKQALKEKIKAEILSTLKEADEDEVEEEEKPDGMDVFFGADAKDKMKKRKEDALYKSSNIESVALSSECTSDEIHARIDSQRLTTTVLLKLKPREERIIRMRFGINCKNEEN